MFTNMHIKKEPMTNFVEFTCELLTFKGYTDSGMWLTTSSNKGIMRKDKS